MYYKPNIIFDDDGNEHFHDENYQSKKLSYTCDNGHQFSVLTTKPCWCGWCKDTTATLDPYQNSKTT